jgi:hypothetical protein
MAAPALAIRRFALAVEAPSSSAVATARLAGGAVRDLLPAALAERLPDTPDDLLLLIRRVELDLSLGEGDDAQRIATRIADALALALAIARASAPANAGAIPEAFDGGAMPRFTSPAGHVAAFLAALAEGRGCNSWWFRGFDGLRVLPRSAAVRTVLLREPASIGAVFAALDLAARSRLANILGAADADLLLDALAALQPSLVAEEDWIALAAALRRAGARAAPARAVEALMIMAAERSADIGGEIAAGARTASRWLAVAGSAPGPPAPRPPAPRPPAPRPPAPEAIARKRGASRISEPERLGSLLPEALRTALLASEDDSAPAAAGARLFSPLGGYALMLAPLSEIDFAALSPGWHALSGAAPERGLQLFILAAAAGDRRLLGDPFWRTLLALPPRVTVAELVAWFGAAPPVGPIDTVAAGRHRGVTLPPGLGTPRGRKAVAALARSTLGRFAARLPGFASASAAFLRTNLLGAGATLWEAEGVVHVRLERPPLDVLLSITGAGEREVALPDGRLLRMERRQ